VAVNGTIRGYQNNEIAVAVAAVAVASIPCPLEWRQNPNRKSTLVE
jgi:hypothetical protein